MAITTASGTKLFIRPTATTKADADTLSEFEAMTGWVEVGEIESLGEFGDESNDVTFSAIGDARVRHLKGARDAGSMAVTVGRDPLDTGQQALVAAEKTKYEYPIKILAADAPTEEYSDTVYYFRGLINSRRENYGENDNVVRITFNIGVNSEIFEAIAADLTP